MKSYRFIDLSRVWSWLPAVLTGLTLIVFGWINDIQATQSFVDQKRMNSLEELSVFRAKLEGLVNSNSQRVTGLVAAIAVEPDISASRFEALASPLISNANQLTHVAAAPNNIIRYIYPKQGNEAALGLDYRTVPDQLDGVERARLEKDLVLVGPIQLVQGGLGLIARHPVFHAHGTQESSLYWGVVSSVIDLQALFKASGLEALEHRYRIALRQSDSPEEKPFFGEDLTSENPVSIDITMPNGMWVLTAIPQLGWYPKPQEKWNERLNKILLGLLLWFPFFLIGYYTVRKNAADERYNSLFEVSPVGIVLSDLESGEIIEANRSFLDLSGYDNHQLTGRELSGLLGTNTAVPQEFSDLKSTRPLSKESEITTKEGRIVPVLRSEISMANVKGRKLLWTFVDDISPWKKAELGLRRSQKMEAVGQLTGGVAHDFNNILAIIFGNIELIQIEKSLEGKVKSRIDEINRAAIRASDLTKQLLGFSKTRTSQAEVTDINQLIVEMKNLLKRSVTPQIKIKTDFSRDCWLTEIDPGDFQDALLNLCLNAKDAINGYGEITIKTENVEFSEEEETRGSDLTQRDYVALTVTDNGHGIEKNQIEHVFEPFFSSKLNGKGTGLGLSMVYGFVNRSGGKIDVESVPGEWTRFTILLPRTYKSLPVKDGNTENTENGTDVSKVVLVVDDEYAVAELSSVFLQENGYKVFTAQNARQALEVMRGETQVDLLITDVVMPGGISGYDLAREASAIDPALKVLVVSGYTGTTVSYESPQNKKYPFLAKPYSHKAFLAKVKSVISS